VALVLDWQKKLGYRLDPFITSIPRPAGKFLVGTDTIKNALNLFLIKEERVLRITGKKGCGKSMLLHWIDEELKPSKAHAQQYLDAATIKSKGDLIETLYNSRRTVLERIKPPKGDKEPLLLAKLAKEHSVLLIDNVMALPDDALAFLTTAVEKTPTQLIVTDTPERMAKSPLDGIDAELPECSGREYEEILRKRIAAAGQHDLYPFTDDDIKHICKAKHVTEMLERSRERAIERSVTISGPAPAPTAKGFISISVGKPGTAAPPAPRPQGQAMAKPVFIATVKEQPKPVVPAPAPASTVAEDAQALSKIIAESSKPKEHAPIIKMATPPPEMNTLPVRIDEPKEKKHQKTKLDKLVAAVAEKNPTPAAKTRAKAAKHAPAKKAKRK
jgi:hypothetical protein